MIISVINHTSGLLSDAEVQRVIRAVNRQLTEDFDLHWGMSATMRLEGHAPMPRTMPMSDIQQAVDMRGDAVIYLWHPVNIRIALGYHANNFFGIPYGYVFPAIADSLGEPWSVTLSHEALEMVADPDVNLLVMGPNPKDPTATVFHWYEVCDAVQTEHYQIDGVDVSNFVLPLYFSNREEAGSRNDFLGRTSNAGILRSFGTKPGGYVGFFNPVSNQHELFSAEGDNIALNRSRVKHQLGLARRSRRYQFRTTASEPTTSSIRQFLGGV